MATRLVRRDWNGAKQLLQSSHARLSNAAMHLPLACQADWADGQQADLHFRVRPRSGGHGARVGGFLCSGAACHEWEPRATCSTAHLTVRQPKQALDSSGNGGHYQGSTWLGRCIKQASATQKGDLQIVRFAGTPLDYLLARPNRHNIPSFTRHSSLFASGSRPHACPRKQARQRDWERP